MQVWLAMRWCYGDDVLSCHSDAHDLYTKIPNEVDNEVVCYDSHVVSKRAKKIPTKCNVLVKLVA